MKAPGLEKLDGTIVRVVKNNADVLLELKNSGYGGRASCYHSTVEFIGITAIDGKNDIKEWHELLPDWSPNGDVGKLCFDHGTASFHATTRGPGAEWINEYRIECSDVRWSRQLDTAKTLKVLLRRVPFWVWLGVFLALVWIWSG